MTIIAIANQKGGVGKTTTGVHLAHGMARAGQRVLAMDLDPQGHFGLALGFKKEPGLYRVMIDDAPLGEMAVEARDNLFVILGDKTSDRVKRDLVSQTMGVLALKRLLKDIPYDHVILDLAPSLDILQVAALLASDFVLIPTRLDRLAMDGVQEILRTMREIQEWDMGEPANFAVLPTMFERRTRETEAQWRELVTSALASKVLEPIPQDTRVREAAAYGQTLWEFSPRTPAMIGMELRSGKRRGGYIRLLQYFMEYVEEPV
jgi:chromosome partitioning protein